MQKTNNSRVNPRIKNKKPNDKTFLAVLKHMEETGKLPLQIYGEMRCVGLCQLVQQHFKGKAKMKKIFKQFDPTDDDIQALWNKNKSTSFWASDSSNRKYYIATGLRKTIIAFCAVLNKEI